MFEAIKAIISIPGWAERSIESRTASDTQLATMYRASVWAYRCINLRSDSAESVPWRIYRAGDEKTPLPRTHPAVRLLSEIGPERNWADFIRATEADLNIFGKAYWLKQRIGRGRVATLMRLNPATVKLEGDQRGISGFTQTLNGQQEFFPRGDVAYFHTYHPTDDLGGLSPLQVAMTAAGAGRSSSAFTAAFFENYAIPPLLMTTEQPVTDAEMSRIKAWWDRTFRGAKRQHRVGIMGSGLKPHMLGYPTKDLALSDVLAETRREVCAAFGVPPSLAGAWEAVNYSTAQEQRKSFWQDTIIPRLDYVASVIDAEVLPEFEPGLTWRWRYGEIEALAPDLEIEARRHAVLVQAGIEDPASAAEALGVEPVRVAQTPVGALPAVPNPTDALQDDLAKWQRKALNRVKAGRPALCDFESDAIPAAVAERVKAGLAEAESVEAVRVTFKEALM
jgi:HK97 family phage portal protein